MGMFDTIYLECPDCGKKNELQTKWGACVLGEYSIDDAPPDAMEKFVQNSVECEYCECEFKVEIVTRPQYRVVKLEDDDY